MICEVGKYMIIDSFDNKSKPFITPDTFYKKVERNDLVCIVTFSKKVIDYVIEKYNAKLYASYKTSNDKQDIYIFNYQEKDYLIYMTGIGATWSSTVLVEVMTVTGAHKFVYFGSCGVLDDEKCRGKIVVPTESYRDEGISYHYIEKSDYIEIRNHQKIEDILSKNNIPFVSGRIWTTDAIYMETINKVNQHKKEGCLAVEMEVSGVEAVSRYYDIENYHMLFSADSLSSEDTWERKEFGAKGEHSLQYRTFEIALLVAQNL